MEQTASQKGGNIWTGADVLAATGGRIVSGDSACRFSGVGIDSRALDPDDLFVAIVGKTHDGHRFCPQVVAAGNRGLLVNAETAGSLPVDEWTHPPVFCVAVSDTTRALGDMAAWHRKRCPAKVAAITGSCGKTTTREMTASVLRQRYRTLASRKNFNNEIGLPLTLLALEADHEWAVAELGMNRPGEIARLGEISRPDIGVITNVGAVHLEGLGTVENVAAAKGELLPAIDPAGIAVLNADDVRLRPMADRMAGRVLLFGQSEDADIRGREVVPAGAGTAFELVLPGGSVRVTLRVPGRFMVSNALAAAAVGHVAGLSPEEIRTGLETFEPADGRMNLVETVSGIHVLDDSYNANPVSMAEAISTLGQMKGEGRATVVLGDMYELGDRAQEFHHALGVVAVQAGIVRLYATGTYADAVREGALEAYMKPEDVMIGSHADILADLRQQAAPGDWVLVKGSRAAEMEKIVSGLVAWAGGKKKKK
jgi:UDP-N-acetylmuramoyl-tripeptide--D-alanyl-D-alanine ligase